MKKPLLTIAAITQSLWAMAQDGGMMGGNNHSNGNSSFTLSEILLFAIVVILIVGGLGWYAYSIRNGKSTKQ